MTHIESEIRIRFYYDLSASSAQERSGSVLEVSSPQIVWLPALPRRFGTILEKILDRHERSGIAVQRNGVLALNVIFRVQVGNYA